MQKYIEKIVLRPIVIVYTQDNRSLSLYMKDDIVHSIAEA